MIGDLSLVRFKPMQLGAQKYWPEFWESTITIMTLNADGGLVATRRPSRGFLKTSGTI
jgi:hypothetical protein